MTQLMSNSRNTVDATPAARWAAYGAATWATGFAAVNVYLQFAGIDDPLIQRSWDAFTIINLGVAALKLFGAAVALAAVQRWGRALPDRAVALCAWGAAGMLLLYAAFGAVVLTLEGGWLSMMDAGGTFRVPAVGYLGFFLVPGLLFAVAAADHLRRTATPRAWAVLGVLGSPLVLGAVFLSMDALLG